MAHALLFRRHYTMIYRKLALWLCSTVATGALTPIFAQLGATTEDAVQMDRFEVSDVPIEEQILPTARPFNSVFGFDKNIVDTPRSVTIISREQLTAISIQDVRDFSKLTSSSYTRSNFGAPANPDIRGQYSDVFINGMRARATSNGNGIPIDFNAVESVNIVKGPATAVQGASMYVGGFVDLVTKRPYFDRNRGSVAVTVGSYDTKRWTVDLGGPFSDALAYRFSYSGEDSEGYYYDGFKKTHSVYGALSWRPSDTYELFLAAQIYYANYTENFGVNRPTQNLIDRGLYTTGINTNNGVGNAPSDAQNSVYVQSGFPVTNNMAWGPEVGFDRRSRLLRPGDDSLGRNFNLQAIQTVILSPTLTLVNNTLGTYVSRDTFSSYYYSEIVDPSYTIENRTELRGLFGPSTFNTGLALRYQRTTAYNDFFFEPANVWDLTKDHAFINIYNSAAFQQSIVAGDRMAVPGWSGRVASPGVFNGDTNDSKAISASPFIQNDLALGESFVLTTGGRVDFLKVDARDPLAPVWVGRDSDEISLGIPSANVSLLYRITPAVSTYATYNYSQNTSGAIANGGGFGQFGLDANNDVVLDGGQYRQPSELLEAGIKGSLLENRLFLAGAVFKQKRSSRSSGAGGTVLNTFEYEGFEIEANFQPNKNFYAVASYSYVDAQTPGPGFDVANVTPWLPGATPAFLLSGPQQVQGLPKSLVNAIVAYKFDNGLSFSVNGIWHSEVNNNIAGTLVIPSQIEIDASIAYEWAQWTARLTVLNVTDEKNWSAPNAVYGNESIVAEEAARGELTLTYRF